MAVEEKKIAAAKEALKFIEDGMVLGVGSGSTVKYFIDLLGDALKNNEIKNVIAIPSSYDTEILLKEKGIPISSLLEYPVIDVVIDGADSVLLDKKLLIKGGGGAFLREKVIAYAARSRIIIVDDTKLNRDFPIPIEVLPFALGHVIEKISSRITSNIVIRKCNGKVGPCISDNGNMIIDVYIPKEKLNKDLEVQLNMIPGVLENGIFNISCRIIVGAEESVVKKISF